MVGVWPTLANEGTNGTVTAAEWNALVGATGALQFLYQNSMVPLAVNTTEQSTASTSAVDLVTLTPSTSIGTNDWALLVFEFAKYTSANGFTAYGVKINSTTVLEASNTSGKPRTSATNQAESGFARILIPPRSTANYGFGLMVEHVCFTTAGAITTSTWGDAATGSITLGMTAAVPNAAITSVTIRGIGASGTSTARVKNAALYQLRNQ